MPLINKNRNTCLAHTVTIADTFFTRLKGLLGKAGLPGGHCLILKPCRSVHTMFMKFPIDLLFLDKDNRVVGIISNLTPFKMTGIIKGSRLAVELPAGTIASTGTVTGDTVIITRGDNND